jgi:uncharacterized protein (TIGR00255 family)
MLRSMTGFGRAEQTQGEKTFMVEIKALNGKQFELQLKIPPLLKSYEFDIRNILQENLFRGTIDCYVNIKQNGTSKPVVINTDLVKAYYLQLKTLAQELDIDTNGLLSSLVRLPEVVTASSEILAQKDFDVFADVLRSAIKELNGHRVEEGVSLEKDLLQRIANIKAEEEKILLLAPQRNLKIREEINTLLEENVGIHEEQIRLRQHCEYFAEILNNNEDGKGKKLSFLLQEIGREINTTGSKAYDVGIQKCVVNMKDELEKAKEQVLNVL